VSPRPNESRRRRQTRATAGAPWFWISFCSRRASRVW
jgi:hypothetical protein